MSRGHSHVFRDQFRDLEVSFPFEKQTPASDGGNISNLWGPATKVGGPALTIPRTPGGKRETEIAGREKGKKENVHGTRDPRGDCPQNGRALILRAGGKIKKLGEFVGPSGWGAKKMGP